MWQIESLDQAEEISVRKKKNEVKDKKKRRIVRGVAVIDIALPPFPSLSST